MESSTATNTSCLDGELDLEPNPEIPAGAGVVEVAHHLFWHTTRQRRIGESSLGDHSDVFEGKYAELLSQKAARKEKENGDPELEKDTISNTLAPSHWLTMPLQHTRQAKVQGRGRASHSNVQIRMDQMASHCSALIAKAMRTWLDTRRVQNAERIKARTTAARASARVTGQIHPLLILVCVASHTGPGRSAEPRPEIQCQNGDLLHSPVPKPILK